MKMTFSTMVVVKQRATFRGKRRTKVYNKVELKWHNQHS